MDNELLITLLEQNNRLIIPELGAFLKKEQGESHTIVFTPFLKKEDGVLQKAVQDHFFVEQDEADTIISEFVKEVRDKLADNSRYYIDSLGTLKLDVNGALSFFYDPKPRMIIEPKTQKSLFDQAPTILEQPKRVAVDQNVPTMDQTPRVVSDQSPMKSMLVEEPVQQRPQPFTPPRPVQQASNTEPMPLRPRPVQPQPSMVRASGQPQQSRPIPQPAQRAPQPRPANAPQQNQTPNTRPANPRPQGSPNGHRPVQKGKKSSALNVVKSDIWLIVAIVAAIIVIALIIYGYVNTDPQIQLQVIDEAVNANTPVA